MVQEDLEHGVGMTLRHGKNGRSCGLTGQRTAGTKVNSATQGQGTRSALHNNLTLLTNNRSHFERIEGLRMESVE